MNEAAPMIFSLETDSTFAARVAGQLGTTPARHEEREFGDGEHKIRPLEDVAGRRVWIVQSIHGDSRLGVNDKLVRVLFLAGALRDAGAADIGVAAPYLCYGRKDRRTKPRDPVTTRYLAQLFEAMGIDRIVTLEAHNPAAFENAFRCPAHAFPAAEAFVEHFAETLPPDSLCVASPDVGGLKRSELFRETLEARIEREVTSAFVDKKRSEGVVSGRNLVAGDVRGRHVIVFDDLIASGGTMVRAARAFLEQGASSVHAAATHGLFSEKSDEVLAVDELDSITITDTVPPFRVTEASVRERLRVLEAAPLVARMIREASP